MASVVPESREILCLFDVDGTVTPARSVVTPEMKAFMKELRKKVTVALVSGSDFPKVQEQMGSENVTNLYDYVFSENGLVAYKNGELIHKQVNASRFVTSKLSTLVFLKRVNALKPKRQRCSIGGQISFDVFPKGWDKTYCLGHIEVDNFKEIHFFGDKCYQGGNDYEIYMDERTRGHIVTSPEDTMNQLKEIFSMS
ncbi:PREDICTED: phosphomannomutase-like [Acropora digitifera]|uniref:phosphomannomutase-like n=1 Tax=Acropora digitifera TaxID=70779 RepID=UPI00077A17C6|nr:PREDICTED: phosphomannomutase-like [Acropora digitifera]